MDFNTKVLKVKIPSILPREYKQLEYIQSSGNQYLITNIIPNGNEHFKIEFTPLEFTTSVNYIICGARDNETYGIFVFGSIADTYGGGARLANFGVNQSISKPALNQKHIIEYNKEKMWYDGTQYIATGRSIKQIDARMIIFAGNTEGQGITGYTKMRLYSFIVYNEDGTIKENWTPAKRVSDNVIGMYDTITKTFFTNQGSGAFTGGSELTEVNVVKISKDSQVLWRGVPDEYQRLNFIQTTGTQYIDTGIVINANNVRQNIKIETNCAFTDSSISTASQANGKNKSIYMFFGANTSRVFYSGMGSTYLPTTKAYDNNYHKHKLEVLNNVGKYYIDNVVETNYGTIDLSQDNASTFQLGRASDNTASPQYYYSKCKFRRCSIYLSNTLVVDLIPAKRVSDNVIGMYDTITKTFFTNAGSGAFIGG